MQKHTGGIASIFDRRYLEFNLVGTLYKKEVVIGVSNKYIITTTNKYPRKGAMINFKIKEEAEKYITPDTSYDGCMDH